MNPRYDFVVAGGGAAGCALAGTLAEGGARVLLVEKGTKAGPPPADAMEAITRYYTAASATAATGNCLLPVPTGTVLGGTTTINSGTCLKTPDDRLEAWERASSGAFDAAEFRGFLDEAWTRLNVRQAPPETMSASSRLFLEGLERLRVPGGHRLHRAEKGCVGSGRCCFICPSGGKMTADKAFLRSYGERSRTVLLETELTGIEPPSREGEDVGVTLRTAGREDPFRVLAGELILSAGTLQTPYLVRRFRLGPRWAAAGDGLSLHPASKVFAEFDERLRSWTGVPQGAGLEDPDEPRVRYEGVYTPPEIAAITMPLEGRALREWLDRFDRVATFGYMIQDASRGTVRHPVGPAMPVLRYRMVDGDLRLMLRAMRFIGKVFFAAGARRVVLPVNRAGCVVSSASELDALDLSTASAAELQMMAFHPLGTCGLGRVVDTDLKLCPGVRVCDGSVVPESLGVNPQVTIYAFALRLARRLLAAPSTAP